MLPSKVTRPIAPAIPAARRAFLLFDEADRPAFGRTGYRHGPGVAEEAVERVELLAQYALDMIDGVDQPRIELDLAPPDDLHGARHADPRLVVAVDVRAHRQFALVLHGIEQFANALGILDRVAAARDRAADRAGLDPLPVDADIHLRRGGDQKLTLAEVDQGAIGGGVGLPQPVKDDARLVGAAVREELPAYHLKQIAAHKRRLGALDERGVFARTMVALERRRRKAKCRSE